MLHFIYDLHDPRDRVPFYVGVTNDLDARYQQHIAQNHVHNKRLAIRIDQLLFAGVSLGIHVIEVVYSGRRVAYERERYWVQDHLSRGIQLTNTFLVKRQEKQASVRCPDGYYTSKETRERFGNISRQWLAYYVRRSDIRCIVHPLRKARFYCRGDVDRLAQEQSDYRAQLTPVLSDGWHGVV